MESKNDDSSTHEKDTIDESLTKYNQENSIGNLYDKIKTSFQNKINSKLTEFIQNMRNLANYNYMLMQDVNYYQISDIKFILKKIDIKKDTISSNLDDLIGYFSVSHIDEFAQIVYASLSDLQFFSEEERNYFALCTVPSIFKYFIIEESQNNFTRFVYSLFQIHIYLRGYFFTFNSEFISKIILSFFLTFGTAKIMNDIFEYLFIPLAKELYEKSNVYDQSRLGIKCTQYESFIETLANNFLSRLWYCIPLIGREIRMFISSILELDKNNIIMFYFIFDNLVNQSLLFPSINESEFSIQVKKDLIEYFQKQYNAKQTNHTNKVMNSIIAKLSNITDVEDITNFNSGLLHFPMHTYFSFYDLFLINQIVKKYSSFVEKCDDTLKTFLKTYKSHELSTNLSKDVFIKVNIYQLTKLANELSNSIVPLKNTETIDTFMATLNINDIHLSKSINPTNIMINLLAHQVPELRYHMNQSEISFSKIAGIAENNRANYQHIVKLFNSTLDHLNERCEELSSCLSSYKNFLLENIFAREIRIAIFDKKLANNPSNFPQLSEYIENYCSIYDIQEYKIQLQKIGLLVWYDILCYKYNESLLTKIDYNYENMISKFNFQQQIDKRSHNGALIQKCIDAISALSLTNNVRIILKIILQVFQLLDTKNIDLLSYVIIESKAYNLFNFEKFMISFITNRHLFTEIYGDEAHQYVALFISCINHIRIHCL